MKCARIFLIGLWLFFSFYCLSVVAQDWKKDTTVTKTAVANIYSACPGEVLLDFSSLVGDSVVATEVDFSDMADYYGLAPEEKTLMKTDLSLANWRIFIPPASRELAFKVPSYLAPAKVKDSSPVFAGQQVLGLRLFFPMGRSDSYSLLPPFPLPFYAGEDGNQFVHWGVVKNVGAIKEIQLEVYAQYSPVSVFLVLEDMSGKEIIASFGSLNFLGWRRLVWRNPAYAKSSANNIVNPKLHSPSFSAAYRLKSLVFYHNRYSKISDVEVYLKDIKVIYDKAWEEKEMDVDNKTFWQNYYNSLDVSGFPSYKICILKRYLLERRAASVKSKETFIDAKPIEVQK